MNYASVASDHHFSKAFANPIVTDSRKKLRSSSKTCSPASPSRTTPLLLHSDDDGDDSGVINKISDDDTHMHNIIMYINKNNPNNIRSSDECSHGNGSCAELPPTLPRSLPCPSSLPTITPSFRPVNVTLVTSNQTEDLGPSSGAWTFCDLFKISRIQVYENCVKAVLMGMAMTLDYFNMLIAMTFNVGLFIAVIAGYVMASLMFGHVLENYSALLHQRYKGGIRK
eukprot:CAMPEP_0175084460 /NCGR_PEP_ID=MMETSP0052_2-20121109/28073_1 /TAXON_ID=51329 ORGANISM="Polytomella parva, Strain SAG 63-3" /NCGR_SAMPLE_ID=MMETSP0052_2 /ASSEMBLY_ACC=CAM_ASM_000194 /LENGTH=225 /DNA_ID=CAMNT_0016356269 /DNA_START=72 /DNA_END=747 /DNA_ORIENTATION=-